MVRCSVAIIGGGAAGFFTAVNLAERSKAFDISIYEGSTKLLSKVLISGGGRCNVTNAEKDIPSLLNKYPRGHKMLGEIFEQFSTTHTVAWFEKHGVKLKTEADGRIFPTTDRSRTIYNCLVNNAEKEGVHIHLRHRLRSLKRHEGKWQLDFGNRIELADVVVLCTGGNEMIWEQLGTLDLEIEPPLPSLFTLTLKDHKLAELSGISFTKAKLKILDNSYIGPLLITHAGLSGPVTLSLSAWEARSLAHVNYTSDLSICWDASLDKETLEILFLSKMAETPKEKVRSTRFDNIPKRLFQLVCDACEVQEYTNWSEIGKKKIRSLVNLLTEYPVQISGKSTFKEEFVTAGGVKLDQLDLGSLESKAQRGLYFAGEVLNIDAETGGYNFQAAWSTAFIVARHISTQTE